MDQTVLVIPLQAILRVVDRNYMAFEWIQKTHCVLNDVLLS